jgi:hypothetical protein
MIHVLNFLQIIARDFEREFISTAKFSDVWWGKSGFSCTVFNSWYFMGKACATFKSVSLYTQCTWFQKNLGYTSKFSAPETWHEAISVLGPTNVGRHLTKCSRHGQLVPGVCLSLLYCDSKIYDRLHCFTVHFHSLSLLVPTNALF